MKIRTEMEKSAIFQNEKAREYLKLFTNFFMRKKFR